MLRTSKFLWIAIAGSVLLVGVLIAGAVLTTSVAAAQSVRVAFAGDDGGLLHRGGPGGRFGPQAGEEYNQYLADALGITVEELQQAREDAYDAALDQAVAAGALTQAQADAIRTLRGVDGFGFGLRFLRGADLEIDEDALLADALNISVDELQAARDSAKNAALDAAVTAGGLTQEQADLMRARSAVKDYIDQRALTAGVLGLSVDELDTKREAGASMTELLEEAGLTQEEFRSAMQAAYEAALQQAVEDGEITQEQADQLMTARGRFGGFDGGRGRRGGPGLPGGLETPPQPLPPAEDDSGTGA